MTRPLISIFNAETQEEVIREMNDSEFAQYEIDRAKWEEEQAARGTTE